MRAPESQLGPEAGHTVRDHRDEAETLAKEILQQIIETIEREVEEEDVLGLTEDLQSNENLR